MVSNIQNILFALLPEAIYFTLFLIYTKGYKTKKFLLFTLLFIGYVVLKLAFPLNIHCQVGFLIYTPVILKLLYKDKFHISDAFVLVYASWLIILETLLILPIHIFFNDYLLAFIFSKALMFLVLFLLKNKLNKIYRWIIPQWNRNYEKPNKIKAITIRQVCVISFNVMIFVLYLGIQYIINQF